MTVEYKKVAVVPAGALGIAMTKSLADRGYSVNLFFRNPDDSKGFNRTRRAPRLPKVMLSGNVRGVSSIAEAVTGVDLVFIAPPAEVFPVVYEEIEAYSHPFCDHLFGSKGLGILKNGSIATLPQIALEKAPRRVDHLGVMSGPNLAYQIAIHEYTATAIAAFDEKTSQRMQANINTNDFRVYTETDVYGVAAGGALKNIYAVGKGIGEGWGVVSNTEAAYMTRSLWEMKKVGKILGADNEETFSGLSGLGDLWVSCSGKGSRNKRAGKDFARGKPLSEILSSGKTLEGFHTVKIVVGFASKIEVPIAETIHGVLYKGLTKEKAFKRLMGRPVTSERVTNDYIAHLNKLAMIVLYKARSFYKQTVAELLGL